MSYARTLSVGLVGMAGRIVQVEADLANGLPGLALVGLPDAALYEARDRIRAAITNSGEQWPNRRMTVNLLPAAVPKHGSTFDLAMALALLAGAGVVSVAAVMESVLIGELGLDGTVRPVRGVLPCVLASVRAGLTRVVVPLANAREAALVPGALVNATDSLGRMLNFLRGREQLLAAPPACEVTARPPEPDLAEVAGQEYGRRCLEVTAAGGHHLSMIGPPGSGKSMLAQRLPSILPELSDTAAMEVTAVHSIAGVLAPDAPLIRRPPFQSPHHTASVAALVGGGSGLARPGALSLAHRGVLFLDEAPEFGAPALNALRQPLENGEVVLSRANGNTRYPARIQLVLAANPCPCAKPAGDAACECSALVRRRYIGRLSGPLMDRIDLQVPLMPITASQLLSGDLAAESSACVAERVARARAAATSRWAGHGWQTNAEVPGAVLRGPLWRLPRVSTVDLCRRLESGALSARGYDRVVRLAWTIADLDGRDRPDRDDVGEALGMRSGDVR